MLIRVRGGESGIREYLESGRKGGRDHSRGELDERVILAGDLQLTEAIIDGMAKQGERYLHITLSFKEDEIGRDQLVAITEDFRQFAMTAFDDDEYQFYAEAHLPRLKSYIHQGTAEFIERKPHIHIVIPTYNLLSQRSLNPFGKVEQQTPFLEAFQEHINAKYGLASPKEHRRVAFTDESTMIARYKGDYFKGSHHELKQALLGDLLSLDATSYDDFKALVGRYGSVRVRNAGSSREYLNVKPEGAAKGINLKEFVFSREFIAMPLTEKRQRLAGEVRRQYEEAKPGRPASSAIEARLAEWHSLRAAEIKYINSGNRRLYADYRGASREQKQILLKERAAAFYAKHRRHFPPEQTHNERPRYDRIDRQQQEAIRRAAHLYQSDLGEDRRQSPPESLARVRNLSSVMLVHHGRDFEMLLPAHAPDRVGRADITPSHEMRRAGVGAAGSTGARLAPINVPDQLLADRQTKTIRQRGEARTEFDTIKRELDAGRLLVAVSQSHGVVVQKYEVTKGKDGGDRIRCGNRSLNLTDFLTHELHLPWQEAMPILRRVYAEQQRQQTPGAGRSRPDHELFDRYRHNWVPQQRKQREQAWSDQKQHEQERRAALRQQYQEQRRSIQGQRGLTAAERKAALSLARMARLQDDAALRQTIQQERVALKSRYQLNPSERYQAYLTEQAGQGDSEALTELRRQRGASPLPEGDRIESTRAARSSPVLSPSNYRVDGQGNVTYYDEERRAMFTDTGPAVEFKQTERQVIETGLRLAVLKFGSNVHLEGTDHYKQAVVETAADVGLYIKFSDQALQMRYEQRLDAIKASRDVQKTNKPPECQEAEGRVETPSRPPRGSGRKR